MNMLTFILKGRTNFSLCYRNLYLLSSNTVFHQRYKQNLSLSLAQKESLTFLSRVRHASFFSRRKNQLKNFFSNSTKVRMAGNIVYEKVADEIDHKRFFQCFELPDTFQSWFLAIQIHVWMVVITTIAERHGREFRNALVDAMWNDVEIRMANLAKMRSSLKKKYLNELVSQFQGALIAYDEGILSDDTVLAAAAWRTVFACKMVDPELLENIVLYMRRQVAHLNSQPSEKIMMQGSISFLPLQTILTECKA